MTRSEVRAKYGQAGVDEYDRLVARGESDSFITSAVIAAVTDSAIIGTVLGGDVVGAVLGDIFNGGDLF